MGKKAMTTKTAEDSIKKPEEEAEADEAANEILAGKTCTECMEEFEGAGKRCLPCNRVRVRIHRCKDAIDSEALKDFGNMPKDEKADWYKENHDLCGEALVASIHESVEKEKTESTTLENSGKGFAFDSPDLAARYKNKKPEILENVRASAKTFIHPLRKCKMYEDIDYESKFTEKQESSTKRTLSISTDRKRAKAKAAPKQTDDPKAEPVVKKLTPADVKYLDNAMTTVTECIEELEGKADVIVELGALLPPYLQKQLEVTVASARQCGALIHLYQSQGEGSMKELKLQFDTLKKDNAKQMQAWKLQEKMARAAKKAMVG
jgi:hypothetical protein